MEKDENLRVRLPRQLKEELRQTAEAQGVRLSDLVLEALRRFQLERGRRWAQLQVGPTP